MFWLVTTERLGLIGLILVFENQSYSKINAIGPTPFSVLISLIYNYKKYLKEIFFIDKFQVLTAKLWSKIVLGPNIYNYISFIITVQCLNKFN